MNRAILLSAGEGTRLRPLTSVLPKCLVPVMGRPLLGHWLDALADAGVTEVLVNTCYMADLVEAYLAAGCWRCDVNVKRERVLRGTGGSLIDFGAFWRQNGAFLIHADNLTNLDFRAFGNAQHERLADALLTLATFNADEPSKCGIVEADGDGVVTGFFEKVTNPPGRRASAAVFALSPALASVLPAAPREAMDFSRDVVPNLVGRMRAWHHDGFHRDLGEAHRYLSAQWEYPEPVMRADASWSWLLGGADGALGARLLKAVGDLAVNAGYRPMVFAHADDFAPAPMTESRIAVIRRAPADFSPRGQFLKYGVRAVVLEVEE